MANLLSADDDWVESDGRFYVCENDADITLIYSYPVLDDVQYCQIAITDKLNG